MEMKTHKPAVLVRVSSPVLSPRPQPESPSGVVDDPEDMIATQRMPSPGRRTGAGEKPPLTPQRTGGEKLPLTPQRAGGEKLPLTPQRAGGEKLPLTPQRTCSGLSTESEADDYRIELPSTQELLQVLAMSSSQSAPSPPVQEMQEEDSESPVRSPSLLEESPPPLVPSDTSTVRSSVRSVSSSGRGVTPSNHPRVLFTGFERDSADEQIVKSLGGTVVERPAECTVLVTTGVKRTIKLMACFARGTPIVTPAWLTKSKQAKCFLDPWQFLVEDKAAEAKFGFCFGLNLRKASRRAHPLLEGWSVYVTPQVRPPPDQLKEVIECAGGLFLPRLPRSSADRVAVISCGEDARHWPAARRLHLPVVSAELLLTGVLHQRIDVRRHALTG
ncbi:Mediator of DNA damage checkpoint protein 1 [Amphibalanus amphitrite]|uniref:Mediator of DNA damage checkpoint protein 1 n=1 Tax=Amphibalanus amphitrite TaxID=1232801 RepID=A0A6A4WS30_AMPAM|nr:Mediator of DNA damage checkpoint protein 1 [Amphibalanus amphitrite]